MKGEKFSEKHGPGATVGHRITAKVSQAAKNNELSCAIAFKLAEDLKASPAEIGKAVDLLDMKLVKCQLGLFGYQPDKKIVKPKTPHDPALAEAIRESIVNHRLACRDAWDIALKFKVPKMAVSAACEALKIKIKPCQLGAF